MLVQILLAVVCLGTLIVKRQTEMPRREIFVWALDASKQGVGSSIGHFSNLFLSIFLSSGPLQKGNECEWYALSYMTDAVFGTAINFLLLYIYEGFLLRSLACCAGRIKPFGDYGSPPALRHWWPQLGIWIVIISISKALILAMLVVAAAPLDGLVVVLFDSVSNKPKAELVLVMIVIPCIVNAVQFWLTDAFLKKAGAPLRNNDSDTHLPLGQCDLDEGLLPSSEHTAGSKLRAFPNSLRAKSSGGGGSFFSSAFAKKFFSSTSSRRDEESGGSSGDGVQLQKIAPRAVSSDEREDQCQN